MIAVLVFDLPEESEDYKNAMNGPKYRAALEEWGEKLRAVDKYGAPAPTRDDWFALLQDHGVEL